MIYSKLFFQLIFVKFIKKGKQPERSHFVEQWKDSLMES
jgi:hypothetical protein